MPGAHQALHITAGDLKNSLLPLYGLRSARPFGFEIFDLANAILYNYNLIIGTISFEWDEKKSQTNLLKHKVAFEEAQTVFFDTNARMIYDSTHSADEDRFILLGLSAAMQVLVVVHCCRGNNEHRIRIISARKATKKENKQYESFLP